MRCHIWNLSGTGPDQGHPHQMAAKHRGTSRVEKWRPHQAWKHNHRPLMVHMTFKKGEKQKTPKQNRKTERSRKAQKRKQTREAAKSRKANIEHRQSRKAKKTEKQRSREKHKSKSRQAKKRKSKEAEKQRSKEAGKRRRKQSEKQKSKRAKKQQSKKAEKQRSQKKNRKATKGRTEAKKCPKLLLGSIDFGVWMGLWRRWDLKWTVVLKNVLEMFCSTIATLVYLM